MALQSFDKENSPYTSTVSALGGAGSMSVVRMRDLADAQEMGLGGSLGAVASVSASSLLRIPLWPGTRRKVIGPGRSLMSNFRW